MIEQGTTGNLGRGQHLVSTAMIPPPPDRVPDPPSAPPRPVQLVCCPDGDYSWDAIAAAVVPFFAARVDEDEQTARAAGGDAWAENGSGNVVSAALARGDYSPAGFWVASASWACEGEVECLREGHATHIARYDPDRALRQVADDRQLLAWYETARAGEASSRGNMTAFERGLHSGAARMSLSLIRRRAEVYDTHPDYKEAWAIRG